MTITTAAGWLSRLSPPGAKRRRPITCPPMTLEAILQRGQDRLLRPDDRRFPWRWRVARRLRLIADWLE